VSKEIGLRAQREVEGYHQLGERIRNDLHFIEYAKGNKTAVQDLARNIEISERTLYYSMAFAGIILKKESGIFPTPPSFYVLIVFRFYIYCSDFIQP